MNLRQILKGWYLKFTEYRWSVGVADYDADVILDGSRKLDIHWIKRLPRGSWFADPFILSVTEDKIIILVEELIYSNNKGRISKLTVDRKNWHLVKVEGVIEIPTHLSFPAYFRENGKVFIYPESTNSGKLTLYEYDEATGWAEPVRTLCSAPVADAVLHECGGRQVILATTSPCDNGRVLDVYELGEKSGTPAARLRFDSRVARNAGFPFKIEGQWYRPAQDCTDSYGKYTVIQSMTEDEDGISFKEVRRFHSSHFNYWEAFHTFNVYEDRFIAVDSEGFRYGLIPCAVSRLRNLFR